MCLPASPFCSVIIPYPYPNNDLHCHSEQNSKCLPWEIMFSVKWPLPVSLHCFSILASLTLLQPSLPPCGIPDHVKSTWDLAQGAAASGSTFIRKPCGSLSHFIQVFYPVSCHLIQESLPAPPSNTGDLPAFSFHFIL